MTPAIGTLWRHRTRGHVVEVIGRRTPAGSRLPDRILVSAGVTGRPGPVVVDSGRRQLVETLRNPQRARGGPMTADRSAKPRIPIRHRIARRLFQAATGTTLVQTTTLLGGADQAVSLMVIQDGDGNAPAKGGRLLNGAQWFMLKDWLGNPGAGMGPCGGWWVTDDVKCYPFNANMLSNDWIGMDVEMGGPCAFHFPNGTRLLAVDGWPTDPGVLPATYTPRKGDCCISAEFARITHFQGSSWPARPAPYVPPAAAAGGLIHYVDPDLDRRRTSDHPKAYCGAELPGSPRPASSDQTICPVCLNRVREVMDMQPPAAGENQS